jgi:VanZ family protein
VVLFIGTSMPGSLKASIEGQLWHTWPWSGSAHFVLFAIIAAIPAYGQGRWRMVRVLALAVCLAAATEFVQQFVPGRHPLLRDALIDLSGAITGLIIATAARRSW